MPYRTWNAGPASAGRVPGERRSSRAPLMLACALAGLPLGDIAHAHGFAGKRFFPATLATEDPFVADELSLPTFSRRKLPAEGEEPATAESETSVEFSKRLTPKLGLGLEVPYRRLTPDQGDARHGFDNVAMSFKYQFHKNDERESIASVGLDWDIGGTGSKRINREPFSTFTPALFFGKGLGDLPDRLKYLKPLAVTGLAGVALPGRSGTARVNDAGETEIEHHPKVLKWGFAVEYSLPYLQSAVKDVGLRGPFNRLIPLVEFSYEKPLSGSGATTGTINPGVLWAGRHAQLGIEAVIPVNDRTGRKTGVMAQLHFYLDDLFPRSLGKPLFWSQP